MSKTFRVYFGSSSNQTHFSFDWGDRKSNHMRTVSMYADYCELIVYTDDEETELRYLAECYNGQVEDPPPEIAT